MGPIHWGLIMEKIIGALENEKVSSTLAGFLAIFVYVGYVWADTQHANLVSKDEFAQLKEEVEAISASVNNGFEDSEIRDASQIVRDIKLELRIAQATGGTDTETLKEDLKHAEDYKDCLIDRKPNCEHKR